MPYIKDNMRNFSKNISATIKQNRSPYISTIWSSKRKHFFNVIIDKKFKNNTDKYNTIYEFSKEFDEDNFYKFIYELEDQYF